MGVNVLYKSNITVIALIIAISAIFSTCNGNPSPNSLCEPGIVEEMPPHIRKVCLALKNSNNLSSALNAYIENEAQALMYRGEDLAAVNTGKRTDVDHVFLRFGKRR